MKAGYLACVAIVAMLVFYIPVSVGQHSSVSGGNLTYAINNTESFVNSVNKSAYLIFYPNLTSSYHYIALAKEQNNDSYAYLLLSKARSDAQAQLNKINSYKRDSLYVLVVSVIVLSSILYVLMRPSRKQKNSRGKKNN